MPDVPDSFNSHALVDHLMVYRKPEEPGIAEAMDYLREHFITLGHRVADTLVDGPDKTVAIRKLHEALMASIAALALNQR